MERFQPLTINYKRSILDVAVNYKRSILDVAAVLDPPLNKELFDSDLPMFIFLRKQLGISEFRKNICNCNVTN